VNNMVKGNDDILYFTYQDNNYLYTLWKMDINSYDSTLLFATTSSPAIYNLTVINELLFFTANNGLWATDGTVAGTIQLANSGSNLASFQDTLYFSRSELWKSDGTVSNTVQVTNIHPDFGAMSLTPAGDLLFLSGDDQVHGRELWASDGTEAGTYLVKDIYPGSTRSGFHYFVASGNRVYFVANDGQHGEELWVSDGTEMGTYLVKDINPGGDSDVSFIQPVNGRVFFVANDGVHGEEIWVSNGTEAGTYMVKDINPNGSALNAYSTLSYSLNNLYFISLDDGIHGVELWVSDGTETGTFLVSDLNPYGDGIVPFAASMGGAGNWLYFSATDGYSGNEVWALDVGFTADYGLSLFGDGEADGFPGQTVTYTMMLTNTGTAVDVVDLSITSTWPISLPITTYTLDAGEQTMVTAAVQIPVTVGDSDADVALITAVSRNDPAVVDTAVLTTTAYWRKTYLPSILRP